MKKDLYLRLQYPLRGLIFIFLLGSVPSFAQTTMVTGVVKSQDDMQTMPGVSVLVKGTQRGTVTNLDGEFNLQAAPNETLVISFIGYTTRELTVQEGQSTFEVILTSSMSDLSEVVIVGYGSQLKREVTGSVQTVSGTDLMDIPAPQITQKLQGRLAGVQINQTTGQPGRGMNVRIRGQVSVSGGSQPLYVVDGFPITGDINSINPDEIEDISVLKDAASTSLYGSRAANGVVLITTKRGKAGQTNVSLNVYKGIQQVPHYNRLEMMDAVEFATFKKEYFEDSGRPVPEMFQNPSSYEGQTQDWYDALLQTAPISNYNLTITSNTEKMRTSVVAGYFDQEGVILNTDFKRFSLRLNTDYLISDKVRVGFNLAPTYTTDNTPRSDGDRGTGVLFNALHTWPNMPIYDESGELTYSNRFPGETGNIFAYPNWVRSATDVTNRTRTTNILTNAFVEYAPIKKFGFQIIHQWGNSRFKLFLF